MRVGRFLKRRFERRRSPRIDGEDLVAYYWTGSIPSPREVRQIGLHGAFIVAPDRFYPGTMVQIVFEDRATGGEDGSVHPHVCVYTRALRRAPDGFCVAFMFGDGRERKRFRRFLDHVKRRAVEQTEPEDIQSSEACSLDAEDHDDTRGPDATSTE